MKQTILDRDQTIAQLREDMTESQHQYTACYDEVCMDHSPGGLGATGIKQTILDRDQTIAQLREDMTESQHQYTACSDEVCI